MCRRAIIVKAARFLIRDDADGSRRMHMTSGMQQAGDVPPDLTANDLECQRWDETLHARLEICQRRSRYGTQFRGGMRNESKVSFATEDDGGSQISMLTAIERQTAARPTRTRL